LPLELIAILTAWLIKVLGLSMFRGINAVNLDAKGRMSIPTKYRNALSTDESKGLIVTIDTESACLLLYPLLIWEQIEAKLQQLPSFDPQARRIQRLLIGHASDVELDSQGRILLPTLLREYAGLQKKTMLI
jgi:MraZ protein